MPLEENVTDQTKPSDLNREWPLGGDQKSEGDNHLRNIKHVLQNLERFLNFDALEEGAVPAVFGGRIDQSGVRVIQGGWEVQVPADFRNLFVRQLDTGNQAPVVYTPLGANENPVSVQTGPLETDLVQGVDSEISSSPIGFTYVATTNKYTDQFTFRGAGVDVERCRIVIRETDVNGPIIYETATAEELRAGGGFTLNSTGDTVISLPQLWTSSIGNFSHISFERWDTTIDGLTGDGIPIRGATIMGQFIPYISRRGYPYTLVPLALAGGGQAMTEIDLTEDSSDRVIAVGTPVSNTTPIACKAGAKYRWEVDLLCQFAGGADGEAAVRVLLNGTDVDYTGVPTVGNMFIRNSAVPQWFQFRGVFEPGVDTNTVFQVVASAVNRTPTILHSFIRVIQAG